MNERFEYSLTGAHLLNLEENKMYANKNQIEPSILDISEAEINFDANQNSEIDLKMESQKRRLPSVSVCIPCVPVHVQYLSDCFISIIKQTVLPEEIVLVVSESTPEIKKEVENLVDNLIQQFSFSKNLIIKLKFFSAIQHAGINRNAAIKFAKGEVVLLIDADDIMYPDRVSVVKNIFFDYPNIVGLMHFFTKNDFFWTKPSEYDEELYNDATELHKPYDVDLVKPYRFTFDIAFGHPCLKRTLFSKEGFEYNSKKICEDVDFIASILDDHIEDLLIYEKPLTFYMQCRSSNDNNPEENKKPLMFDFITYHAPLELNFTRKSLVFNSISQNSNTGDLNQLIEDTLDDSKKKSMRRTSSQA